jgi:hypothetical protein
VGIARRSQGIGVVTRFFGRAHELPMVLASQVISCPLVGSSPLDLRRRGWRSAAGGLATNMRPTGTATTETLTRIATAVAVSTTTSTATATSRTSGETMDPAAVSLDWPRRAGDASGVVQLVEEPGFVSG